MAPRALRSWRVSAIARSVCAGFDSTPKVDSSRITSAVRLRRARGCGAVTRGVHEWHGHASARRHRRDRVEASPGGGGMSNELGANPDLRPERPRPGPRRWPRRLAALAAALAAAPAPAALTLAAAIAALPASAAPPLAAAIVAVLLPTACALAAAAEPAAAIPAPAEEPWDGRFFAAPPPELLAAATAATTAQAKAEAELPVSVLFAEHIYSFDDAGRLSR